MKDHFSAAELSGQAEMPTTERGVRLMASRLSWPRRRRPGRGGIWEFPLSCLPSETQAALTLQECAASPPPAADAARSAHLWDSYDRKPERLKETAQFRLRLVQSVMDLIDRGTQRLRAIAVVARQAAESAIGRNLSVSPGTLRRWCDMIKGALRGDWLPLLAPKWNGRSATAECSVEAWDYFKTEYLAPERPTAQACYERLKRVAPEYGWVLPSLRTFQRRVLTELHPVAIAMKRHGADAARRMYPAQQRDRGVFTALQAVNSDGHKFDVFVKWEDGTIGRPIILAWQDLYSGKVLAWRIGPTESAELVRLSFADLTAAFGIPAKAWFDNGRAFAAKWNTGGIGNRYRFKVKPEDPEGVFKLLGVEVHWTKPFSGQSKPIERAFRDLCAEYVSKHPACAGAYVGNKPDAKPENYGSRAVDIAEFRKIVDSEIAAHNAREGRRAATCNGRSFDATFAESYATSIVRKASEEQRRLLLLAVENVTLNRQDSSIHQFGNRYWCDSAALAKLAGRKVIVRFDPQNLRLPLHVYSQDGRYLATAQLVEKAGFDNIEEARAHARDRNAYLKARRAQGDAEIRMDRRQTAAMLAGVLPPAEAEKPATKVVRPVFRTIKPPAEERVDQQAFEHRVNSAIEAIAEKRRRESI